MTRDDLRRKFPNASTAFLRANLASGNPGKAAVLEHRPAPEPLAKNPVQETNPERVLVCFVSVRKQLIDPDNLCEKFLLDCLRYCRAISGDEPGAISLSTTQRKTREGEAEHTEITVWKIS